MKQQPPTAAAVRKTVERSAPDDFAENRRLMAPKPKLTLVERLRDRIRRAA